MSGIEVAGLVLAVLPLAIQMADEFRRGVKKIQAMRHYDILYDDMNCKLLGVQLAFRQSCELLLQDLPITDAQYRDLIDRNVGWESKELVKALKDSLGPNDFEALKGSARGIRQTLTSLCEQFGLVYSADSQQWNCPFVVDNKVDEDLRKEFFKARVKIEGAFNAEEHLKIITSMQADTNTLRDNVKTSHQLHDQRQSRPMDAVTPLSQAWVSTRDHCKKFLRTIKSAHVCTLHQHSAHLRLKPPTMKQPQYEPFSPIACSFVLQDETGQNDALPWQCRHTHVLPVVPKKNEVQPASNGTPAVFVDPPVEDDNKSQDDDNKCSLVIEISNLCTVLETNQASTKCRGFLPDTEKTCNYHIHNDSCPISSQIKATERKSLRERLSNKTTQLPFLPRERKRIALLLASAVLQLHGTEWLRNSWTLDDVFVVENSEELFLAQRLDKTTERTPPPTKEEMFLRNETLFSLGVALMELLLPTPLPGPGQPDRIVKAISTIKLIREGELPNFSNAVAHCLSPSSPTILDFDLEDELFLKWFYENVVHPLKLDYDVFLDKQVAAQKNQGVQGGHTYTQTQTLSLHLHNSNPPPAQQQQQQQQQLIQAPQPQPAPQPTLPQKTQVQTQTSTASSNPSLVSASKSLLSNIPTTMKKKKSIMNRVKVAISSKIGKGH